MISQQRKPTRKRSMPNDCYLVTQSLKGLMLTDSGRCDDFNDIETIKRCKLNKTPGDLRLHKDMLELKGLNFNNCVINQKDSSNVNIMFFSDESDSVVTHEYIVTVSKHYPHTKPKIRVLKTPNIFVDNEELIIDVLDWSPIQSMKDIILMLYNLSQSTHTLNRNSISLSTSSPGVDDMDES